MGLRYETEKRERTKLKSFAPRFKSFCNPSSNLFDVTQVGKVELLSILKVPTDEQNAKLKLTFELESKESIGRKALVKGANRVAEPVRLHPTRYILRRISVLAIQHWSFLERPRL